MKASTVSSRCRSSIRRLCQLLLLTACAIPAAGDQIPATLRPNWPELVAYPAGIPVWVAASQAFGNDGQLSPDLFSAEARKRLEFVLARPQNPAKGCSEIAWIEQEYVNPPDRSTLARAVASSELAVWGKVVAAEVGFERGDVGQLLAVQPIEILKPAKATPARSYFIFVPAGRLLLAGSQICKEDPRVLVPAIGDEVLLLPHHAPAGENYLNLEYEGSLIAFGSNGEVRLPRILAAEKAPSSAGAASPKAELVDRIRSLAVETEK